MPSPFPGMDPCLEDPSVWMDFHERFITYCSDALNDRLPDAYPLSTIMIPLSAPDPDLPLDLGELFTTTYDRGRYKRSLTYSIPPAAPLAAEDLRCAAALGQSLAH